MKKILFLLVATVMFGAITSCASTKVEEKAADKIPAVVGAEGIERPLWVLSGRESEDGIYAVITLTDNFIQCFGRGGL